MLSDIPLELREFAQWVVWKYERTNGAKPTKVPYDPKSGNLCSVNDPNTWSDFDTAVNASSNYSGIGFVLTDADPFTFIDLDDPGGDAEALHHQIYLFEQIQSYAELSPSGMGLHIICKGYVPSGRRRSKIEVYSSQRYMTMTGNVYRQMPITEQQGLLDILWHAMGGGLYGNSGIDEEEIEDDTTVIQRALNAINGEKFQRLLQGNWEGLYPSQSEADFAFIDIVAFYTKNRNQIARIFRSSPLGQREKAARNDYVASMIERSFDRTAPHINHAQLRANIENYIAQIKSDAPTEVNAPDQLPWSSTLQADSLRTIIGESRTVKTPPPGLLQDIASFIYRAAPRPVPEVAIAGAIGFLSGMLGRAYNVSGTGLNQYVLLLAPTGTGKEAMASGVNKIIAAVEPKVPSIRKFIGPAEISSGQALLRYLTDNSQCFASIIGEFGWLLKTLSSNYANSAQIMLKRVLLDLYSKSGKNEILNPTIYSDKAKNTTAIQSPALTILGEAEQESFYSVLDETLVASGLLPRILTIVFGGARPPLNKQHIYERVPDDIVSRVSQLAVYCHELMQNGHTIDVRISSEAEATLDQFDRWCDAEINSAEKDVTRQLWNRAHIKSLKLASLIAIGDNPTHPVISADAAQWAISVVSSDIGGLLDKFAKGEVGAETSEARQVLELKRHLRNFILRDYKDLTNKARVTREMHQMRMIPYHYIQAKFSNAKLFKDKNGKATPAIKTAIHILIEDGILKQVSREPNVYTIVDPKGLEV